VTASVHCHRHVVCFVIIKTCFVVAESYPFFVGIRGSITIFSELRGNTTHFQNELKETLLINTRSTNDTYQSIRKLHDIKS